MKRMFCVAILSSTAISGASVAAPSLCTPAESIIFSCSTAKSRVISLCEDKHAQTMTYRFGKPGKVELLYSAKQGEGFLYNHYFRAQVDYTRISFVKDGYEYSVFGNYDGSESPVTDYGVAVSTDGDEGDDGVQIKCHSHVVDHMPDIIKRLKCDERSALGCS